MKFNVTIATPSPLIALGSLIFNGSAIWLNSVWETKDVSYWVYLDATPYSSTRQPSNSLLFHADNLKQDEEHTVVVQPASLLQSITVEMDLGDQANVMMSMDDGQLFLQDGFVASGSWNTDECFGTGRADGSCHVSEGSGSEISYTFAGDAITLWGAVENHYALYHVVMDNGDPISYAPANTTANQTTTILAHYSNLGPGSHTLKLTNLPKDGKSRIEVDYAQVYTTTYSSSSTTAGSTPTTFPTSTATAQSSSTSMLSKSTTIGIIVGSLLGVLLFALLFFLYKYRQQNRHLAKNEEAVVAVELGERKKRRESDEETLASDAWSVKEGLELGRVDSQVTVQGVQRPERAAKGEF